MPDRIQVTLTGKRIEQYRKAHTVWVALVVIFVLIQLFASGKSIHGELLVLWLLVIVAWYTYLLITKKTLWHLRKAEVKQGRKEAKKILEDVGIK